jgi:hypothetical protein
MQGAHASGLGRNAVAHAFKHGRKNQGELFRKIK